MKLEDLRAHFRRGTHRAPTRVCTAHGLKVCGKPATVVCSIPSETLPGRVSQWFACDDPFCQDGADTEPIGPWFERHGLMSIAREDGTTIGDASAFRKRVR